MNEENIKQEDQVTNADAGSASGTIVTEEEAAKAAEEAAAKAAAEAVKEAEAAAAKAADDSKLVKVQLTIEATFEIAKGNVKALKASSPENKLATARMYEGRVKSTLKVV